MYVFIRKDKGIKYESESICSLMKITKAVECYTKPSSAVQDFLPGLLVSCEGIPETEVVIRTKDLIGVPSLAVQNEAIERYIELVNSLLSPQQPPT